MEGGRKTLCLIINLSLPLYLRWSVTKPVATGEQSGTVPAKISPKIFLFPEKFVLKI